MDVVLETLGAFSEVIQEEVNEFLAGFFSEAIEQGKVEQVVQWMSAAASGEYGFRNQGPGLRLRGLTRYVDWHFFYPEGLTMVAKPVSVVVWPPRFGPQGK